MGRNILFNLFEVEGEDVTKMEITDVIEYGKTYNDLSYLGVKKWARAWELISHGSVEARP